MEDDGATPIGPSIGLGDREAKLFALRLRMNEARRLNSKATIHSESDKRVYRKPNASKDEEEDKYKLNDTPMNAEKLYSKSKTKDETFGWDRYNQEPLYRAHEKRRAKVLRSVETEEVHTDLDYGKAPVPSKKAMDLMVDDLLDTEQRRMTKHRRRATYSEQDVTYVNERNKRFNQKISRAYDKYAADTKEKLERGTG